MPLPLVLNSQDVLRALRELEGERIALSVLSYWACAGIVVPSVRFDGKRGPGRGRLYSLADLARLRLVVRLRREGVSMARMRAVLAYVEHQLPELLQRRGTRAVLRVDGFRGVIVERPGRAAQQLDGQLLLPLADVQVSERDVRRILAA